MLSGFAVFSTEPGRPIAATAKWQASRWSDGDSVQSLGTPQIYVSRELCCCGKLALPEAPDHTWQRDY